MTHSGTDSIREYFRRDQRRGVSPPDLSKDCTFAEHIVQALRYATKRKEGLVDWSFDITRVARKDLISWAESRVQPYFTRLS